MTRIDERVAGRIALLTVLPLVTSLATLGTGPVSRHPHGVLAWAGNHGVQLRIASITWVVAMLGAVLLAIRLRDALVASFVHRWWAGVLFVQGATVFAAVSVVAAASTWAVAELGTTTGADASTVAALWTLHCALLTFACWGLLVPLLTVGRALVEYSLLGQVAAMLGVGVGVLLLIPPIQFIGLYAFAGWLAVTGMALLLQGRRDARQRDGHVVPSGSSVRDDT